MKSKYKFYTINKSGLHYLPQNYLITYSWKLLSREAINLENEKERIYRNVAFVCTAYSCFISVSIQSLIYFVVKDIRWRMIFRFAFCNRFENISTYTNDPYIKRGPSDCISNELIIYTDLVLKILCLFVVLSLCVNNFYCSNEYLL